MASPPAQASPSQPKAGVGCSVSVPVWFPVLGPEEAEGHGADLGRLFHSSVMPATFQWGGPLAIPNPLFPQTPS